MLDARVSINFGAKSARLMLVFLFLSPEESPVSAEPQAGPRTPLTPTASPAELKPPSPEPSVEPQPVTVIRSGPGASSVDSHNLPDLSKPLAEKEFLPEANNVSVSPRAEKQKTITMPTPLQEVGSSVTAKDTQPTEEARGLALPQQAKKNKPSPLNLERKTQTESVFQSEAATKGAENQSSEKGNSTSTLATVNQEEKEARRSPVLAMATTPLASVLVTAREAHDEKTFQEGREAEEGVSGKDVSPKSSVVPWPLPPSPSEPEGEGEEVAPQNVSRLSEEENALLAKILQMGRESPEVVVSAPAPKTRKRLAYIAPDVAPSPSPTPSLEPELKPDQVETEKSTSAPEVMEGKESPVPNTTIRQETSKDGRHEGEGPDSDEKGPQEVKAEPSLSTPDLLLNTLSAVTMPDGKPERPTSDLAPQSSLATGEADFIVEEPMDTVETCATVTGTEVSGSAENKDSSEPAAQVSPSGDSSNRDKEDQKAGTEVGVEEEEEKQLEKGRKEETESENVMEEL